MTREPKYVNPPKIMIITDKIYRDFIQYYKK